MALPDFEDGMSRQECVQQHGIPVVQIRPVQWGVVRNAYGELEAFDARRAAESSRVPSTGHRRRTTRPADRQQELSKGSPSREVGKANETSFGPERSSTEGLVRDDHFAFYRLPAGVKEFLTDRNNLAGAVRWNPAHVRPLRQLKETSPHAETCFRTAENKALGLHEPGVNATLGLAVGPGIQPAERPALPVLQR